MGPHILVGKFFLMLHLFDCHCSSLCVCQHDSCFSGARRVGVTHESERHLAVTPSVEREAKEHNICRFDEVERDEHRCGSTETTNDVGEQ